MSIPFTQFLRPDGERRHVEIDRPEEVESMARALIEAGFRFEIEELTTGHINMECCGLVDGEDGTLTNGLCRNGPEVPAAVDDMILRAWKAVAEKAVMQ